jgi:GNAT superfamily N-acetyltransferase
VSELRIEACVPGDPRWPDFVSLLRSEGQLRWVLPNERDLRPSTHVLVAVAAEEPVGFVAFLVQEIGPADNCPSLGVTEAKVLAFGVRSDSRGRGIGSSLQRRVLELARELSCYQVRSVTDVWRTENCRVKLGLGFGVHPTHREVDGVDRPAYVFVKALD